MTYSINKRWEDRDRDAGLRAMCDYGVKRRDDETLKFECFNREERDFVHDYMTTTHPDVPFFCTWLNFGVSEHAPA